MTISVGPLVTNAISRVKADSWRGSAWRAHKRKYAATDPGGSQRVSGRYHCGLDQFAEQDVWPALYLSLRPEVCLGEILRHTTPDLFPQLNDYRLSELQLQLSEVLDCRDPSAMGLNPDDFRHDTAYHITRQVAAAAIVRGAEGILVPSATRLGDNLIVFSRQLRPTSWMTISSSRDPRLYVPRDK